MMSIQIMRAAVGRSPQRLMLWLLVSLAFTLGGCMGCGDEAIETDPAAVQQDSPFDEIEEATPEERPFDEPAGGNAFDDGTAVESEDLDVAAIEAQLGDVFFGYDRFELDAEAREILAANARVLADHPKADILIEGHCDERGTAQYNMALGWKRANEVERYLVSLGVDPSRIETVSYGKEKPFVVGRGEAVWSQNRRAHFVARAGR